MYNVMGVYIRKVKFGEIIEPEDHNNKIEILERIIDKLEKVIRDD